MRSLLHLPSALLGTRCQKLQARDKRCLSAKSVGSGDTCTSVVAGKASAGAVRAAADDAPLADAATPPLPPTGARPVPRPAAPGRGPAGRFLLVATDPASNNHVQTHVSPAITTTEGRGGIPHTRSFVTILWSRSITDAEGAASADADGIVVVARLDRL